jgi:hypothetical protein
MTSRKVELLPCPFCGSNEVEALSGAVKDARDELKTFLKSGGFSPWET